MSSASMPLSFAPRRVLEFLGKKKTDSASSADLEALLAQPLDRLDAPSRLWLRHAQASPLKTDHSLPTSGAASVPFQTENDRPETLSSETATEGMGAAELFNLAETLAEKEANARAAMLEKPPPVEEIEEVEEEAPLSSVSAPAAPTARAVIIPAPNLISRELINMQPEALAQVLRDGGFKVTVVKRTVYVQAGSDDARTRWSVTIRPISNGSAWDGNAGVDIGKEVKARFGRWQPALGNNNGNWIKIGSGGVVDNGTTATEQLRNSILRLVEFSNSIYGI